MTGLEKLIQRYQRRAKALNITVKKLRDKDSREVPYYCGLIDELEDVIDDLKEELLK
jgi:uncharacterized protein Yka (UPF0111/DUF47 family)